VSGTVGDITERELIARIQSRLPSAPPWLVVGIGDDAAVVEPERNQLEVLTTDALVDGVHFDRRFTPPRAIGHRALAVNLSDLAAMGATPRLALLSLALPAALPRDDFDGLVEAFAALAVHHRLHVVGGNLTRTPGPLTIDVTVAGSVKRRQMLTRRGALAGDHVYVTGSLGAAAAGLEMLRAGEAGASAPAASAPAASASAVSEARGSALCIERYLYPEARVRIGTLLGRNKAASACMDLSDGLADGALQIAEASGVGMVIDAEALPVAPGARDWFGSHDQDAVLASLSRGDDYELLFTVRPRQGGRHTGAGRHGGVPLTRIGVCTPGPAVMLRRNVNGTPIETAMPHGFSHFH
jgi:thiamine-monophosphate kinase